MYTNLMIGLSRKLLDNKPIDFTKIIKKPKKILCWPAQDDGELLYAIPAIRCLRKHYRDSLITLLLHEEKRGLWHFDSEVDEIIDYRPELLKGIYSKEFRRLHNTFRNRKFDLSIDFNYRPLDKMGYLLYRSRITVRYGQFTGDDYPFKNFIIKEDHLSRDEILRNLDIIKPLGASTVVQHSIWPKLAGVDGKREFKERLKGEGLRRGQIVLTLDGTHWKRKNLEDSLEFLSKLQNVKLIIINPDKLIKPLSLSRHIVMNEPSTTEIAEALSQADGFIGTKNDIFSIAHMLKVPSLIAVEENTRGIPLPGEGLQLIPGKKPFEMSSDQVNLFIQKIL